MATDLRDSVRDYYSRVLQTNRDLKTSACCSAESLPTHLRPVARELHEEVVRKFYGCGSPIPLGIDGCTVLDLGCGSGRDSYLLSKLVGPEGRVIGVDMTAEQLDVARRHIDYHTDLFGFPTPNVEFREGLIEDLAEAGIADGSVDVVVSNCVINLSPDKRRVFAEALRVLKPGGELYFSDVFADRRIPRELGEDQTLRGECLAGAMYVEDFRRMLAELGCADYRTYSSRPITLRDPEVLEKIGHVRFQSDTIRAFKLPLEDRCENFGQVAYYLGTIAESPHDFQLDDHHVFETGKPMLVCSNTARMVERTRFGGHFRVVGDESTHFGLFDCRAPHPVHDSVTPGGCC